MPESPEVFRDWTDKKIPVQQYASPKKLLSKARETAAATPKGVSKPYDNWLKGEDAKKYAPEKTHQTLSTFGKIGAALQNGRFGIAAELYRTIGRPERAEEIEQLQSLYREAIDRAEGRRPGREEGGPEEMGARRGL